MSDSEDDVPLISRARPQAAAAAPASAPAPAATANGSGPKAKAAAAAAKPAAANGAAAKGKAATPAPPASRKRQAPPPEDDDDGDDEDEEDDDEDEEGSSSEDSGSDDEEDVPLSQRKPKKTATASRARPARQAAAKPKRQQRGSNDDKPARKRARSQSQEPGGGKSGQIMWTKLRHAGVMFPPEYVPHGVKMLYDGKPVDLTPEQEEVATMYATMQDSEYLQKPVFRKNFWEGFQEVLGKKHVIKDLDKCDFTPIYSHLMAQKEAKKAMSKEEKAKLKAEKDAVDAKYKTAEVDGRIEPVGNFRVEPPSLFRGRGEHPKMGKIKKRIYPRDIVINIGEGEPIPWHPYEGQTWKEVRHDHTVTWLAYWRDTVSNKDFKYVFLAANSTFKANSDEAKYEKARKLKELIVDIRKNYEGDFDSSDPKKRQMACALYFIDKLALRAGHEKDEDEADTVGCCTLKVENIDVVPPSSVKFDFLGKDSIRYENVVEVLPKVYHNIERFRKLDSHNKRKSPGDQLFDTFDAGDLNKALKSIMDGLSVKVFRTYNASIVLDRLLNEMEEAGTLDGGTIDHKKAEYDKANKEVAILCNHQRSVPKTHGNQMEKIQEKLATLNTELKELEDELREAKKPKGGSGGNPDAIESKIAKKKIQLEKVQLQMRVKEDLKTVALGTSKINYMDPRITIAWCKRNEVPIEKIFPKTLISKFNWAMTIEPDFRF